MCLKDFIDSIPENFFSPLQKYKKIFGKKLFDKLKKRKILKIRPN